VVAVAFVAMLAARPGPLPAQGSPYTDDLVTQARAIAHAIPGDLPRAAHYFGFGELMAPMSTWIQDGGDEVVTAVYSVFQIRYSTGWIMIDAGVDAGVAPDSPFSIDPERYSRTQQALQGANLIVVTHEHHDHVAGAIRTPNVASKTVLTREQVQTLMGHPNVPAIQLTSQAASRFLVIDYERLYPIAPGVVLIKAPGHTPGSQMIYVLQASGQELLFVGDTIWMMAALEGLRQKPEAFSRDLGEDQIALQQQMAWLSGLSERTGVVLVNSHDENALNGLVARGVLRPDLDLSR